MKQSTIVAAGRSDMGRIRKNNEDSIILLPDRGVFCVADGMGGADGGEVASGKTVEAIYNHVTRLPREADMEETIQAIEQAVNVASKDICAWAEERGIRGTGTTAVILVYNMENPSRVVVMHAGDSRAYCLREGVLRQLSRDHSVASDYNLDEEQLPGMFKNIITKAIGLADTVELEKTPVTSETGDVMLLCSDGLTKMLTHEQMTDLIKNTRPEKLERGVQALIDAANDAGGKDNTSVILTYTGELPEIVESEDQGRITEPQHYRPAPQVKIETPSEDSELHAIRPIDEAEAQDTFMLSSDHLAPRDKTKELFFKIINMLIVAIVALILFTCWKLITPKKNPHLENGGVLPPATNQPAARPEPVASTNRVAEPKPEPEPLRAITREELVAALTNAQATGQWGDLDESLRVYTNVNVMLRDANLYDPYSSWVLEWRRQRKDDDVAVNYREITNSMHLLCRQLHCATFPVPPFPQAGAGPDVKADAYCHMLFGQQSHFITSLTNEVAALRREIEALGDQESNLEGLWYVAHGDDAMLEECVQKLRQSADQVRALRRWIDQTQHFALKKETITAVTQMLAPLHDMLNKVWEKVLTQMEQTSDGSVRRLARVDYSEDREVENFLEMRKRWVKEYEPGVTVEQWRRKMPMAKVGQFLSFLQQKYREAKD